MGGLSGTMMSIASCTSRMTNCTSRISHHTITVIIFAIPLLQRKEEEEKKNDADEAEKKVSWNYSK